MNEYSISEWKSVTIQEKFHPSDQQTIAQLRLNDRVEIDEMKEGIRFRAKSWVGVLRFQDFQVQIVPKLAGENLGLVNMLTYTAGVNALKRYDSQRYLELQQQGSLFDLIVWLFCDACEVILAGGMLFDYERQEDTLKNLRGRLLIDKQYRRRFGQIDRLECRFDEHSSNILENQILGLGLYKAGRLAQDRMIRARARRLLAIFSEACAFDQIDIDAARSEILYNRLNDHYREAHQLAWMIIEGLGIEDLFKSNQTPSFAFLLDMNNLFEQFLHRYLSEVLNKSELSVAYQRRDRSIIWDVFRNRSYSQIIPDFLVSSTVSTTRLAVDAKYKIYDDRKVDPGDIAQIFLYAYAYDLSTQPTAVLIYPTEEKSDKRASMIIRQNNQPTGARIHVLGLNIPEALADVRARQFGSSANLIISTLGASFTGIV
jgi:5-methylcytosine-specific restriction enzyme subunit McrC